MKKILLATAISAGLILGGCSSGSVDVNAIINATKAACAFTPAAAGVIALVNAQQSNNAKTAVEIAQLICAAVNNVNPPTGGGTKFSAGTQISVVVETPTGPITIAGTVGK